MSEKIRENLVDLNKESYGTFDLEFLSNGMECNCSCFQYMVIGSSSITWD